MTQRKRTFTTAQKLAATNTRSFRTFLLVSQFEATEIGARIREARDEKGMTQEDLAAVMPFSKRSLQDYEAGVTIPYKHLAEIGRVLGHAPAWFLRGEETTTEADPGLAEEVRALREQVAMLIERLGPQETAQES